MKILIVIDSLGSGGAQKLAVNLASGFIKKNHEIHLFKYDDSTNFFEPEMNELGVKIFKPNKSSNNKIFKPLYIVRSIRQTIKLNKYDGVISFLHIPSFYSSIAKIGIKKSKLIVCELSSSNAPVKLIIKVAFYMSCIFSDLVVANSKNEAKKIRSRFLLSNKTYSIYNGLKIDKHHHNLIDKKKKRNILVLARVAYPKNGYNLVKGLQIFYNKNGWAPKISWYGRFENDNKSLLMQEQIKSLLDKNKILENYIEFNGETKNVKTLYSSYEALILPSIYEGLPLVICEAMIHKCLVLASNVCDHPDILSDNRGILFNPYNPESISNALEKLFNLKEKQKETMINKSYEFAIDNFSVQKMTNSFENLI